MMQLLYRNSQRSGTVTNMIMEEAKADKQVKSDNEDFLLVAVMNHKNKHDVWALQNLLHQKMSQDDSQPSET